MIDRSGDGCIYAGSSMCPNECYHLLHYVPALEYQRKALPVVGILGSKTPHIQNLTVDGVGNAIDLDSPSALGMAQLEMIRTLLEDVTRFVQPVYLVDVCAVAAVSVLVQDW